MSAKEINAKELWQRIWELREAHFDCPKCEARSAKKVKGPDGRRLPIFVCAREFDDIIESLTSHYKPRATKQLHRLIGRMGIRGYDADVLSSIRFFFALLRYHPSYYPDSPEDGFFPYLLDSSMLYFDVRDYRKRNVSQTIVPINDLLGDLDDSSPDFDED